MSSNKVVLVLDREVAKETLQTAPEMIVGSAHAELLNQLAAALQQEGQVEERVEYTVLYDVRAFSQTLTFELALANPGDLGEAKRRLPTSETRPDRSNHRIESKRILVSDLPAVDLDGEEGA